MAQLLLLRHGKSDWGDPTLADHDRPLARRGITAAEAIGILIREAELVPELVVSSTARRACSTAELARVAGGWASRLELEPRLYGAGTSDVYEVTADHAGDVDRLLVVGHEPTMSSTVARLTGARVAMRTATLAVLDVHGSLDALSDDGATLIGLYQPRHLADVMRRL